MTDQTQPAGAGTTAAQNRPATISLITGIIGLFFGISVPIPVWGLFMIVLAGPLSIVAVVTGHQALRAAGTSGPGRSKAIAGLVLGYITLAICVLTTVFWVIQMATPR